MDQEVALEEHALRMDRKFRKKGGRITKGAREINRSKQKNTEKQKNTVNNYNISYSQYKIF